MKRWSLEVTFEEGRAHLGIETQRQWSDRAIERSTPLLFGLYSLVTLFGRVCILMGKSACVRQPGIESRLPPFVMCLLFSGAICGVCRLFRHHPLILAYF